MRILLWLFFIFSFLFLSNNLISQTNEIDSLLLLSKNTKDDSIKVDIYHKVAVLQTKSDPKEAKKTGVLALEIARNSVRSSLANSMFVMSQVYYYSASYDVALLYLDSALTLFKKTGDKKGEGDVYLQRGTIYNFTGQQDSALKAYIACEKIRISTKDTAGIMAANLGMANVNSDLKNYEKAKSRFDNVLKFALAKNDKKSLASVFNNLGTLYFHQQKHDTAKIYYLKSVEIKKEINDQYGLSMSYSNIGIMDFYLGDINGARKYTEMALKIRKQLNDRHGVAQTYLTLGSLCTETGDFKNGLAYYLEGLPLMEEINDKRLLDNVYNQIAKSYKNLNNIAKAFEYYEKYIVIHDELYSDNKTKAIEEMNTKYETEKKDQQLKIQDAKLEKKEVEAELQKSKNIALAIGLSLAGLIGLVMIVAFLQKRKANRLLQLQKQEIAIQKEVVENANAELEEKNQEIMDSITYAKRIQNAILPPAKLVKEYLKESFILYKPKDVVAGDFYWMEHKGGKVLYAAADCTGHGVPGAMVSVVCNNALNRSVREHGLTDPGEILNKTREIVIQEFEKSEEDVKDGMDIALCSIEGNKLQYAGAHNPLWIIRNGEIIETKANKQPIGKFDNPEPYTTHSFDLEQGDSIYVFSDGYIDQFGGEKGKKFKAKAFRDLLISIQDKSMEDQKTIIDQAFESWKGSIEQIDDVCVIGVKI